MPEIMIIHSRDVDAIGYDCYLEREWIPVHSTDWCTVSEDELSALRKFYKPPPRRGYKLRSIILEKADMDEIKQQIPNCVNLALKEAERVASEEKVRKKAAAKRKKSREANAKKKKEEQLRKLAEELGKEVK